MFQLLENNNDTSASKIEIYLGKARSRIVIDKKNKTFIIKGINFNKFIIRLKWMYETRRIEYLFERKYSAWSIMMWEKEKIEKKDMRIVNLTVPLFFALEMYGIFMDLADFYKIDYYKKVADKIYKYTWISNYEKRKGKETDTSNMIKLRYRPKDYQLKFISEYNQLKFIYDLEGYILSFEQGLGKTFTAIALAECLNKDQIIIISPNSITENWAYEIRDYFREYTKDEYLWKKDVYILNNNKYHSKKPKYIIVNQESIDKIFHMVKNNKNTMIIVDESHNFRNSDSKRTNDLLKLKELTNCKDNLLMSGTPIKATPDELIPALRMIDPYFTPELAETYKKAFNINTSEITNVVKRRFNRSIYRKTKSETLKLPEKTISQLLYKIPNPERYLVSVISKQIREEYEKEYKHQLESQKELKIEFNRLVIKYSSATRKETQDYLDFVYMRANPDIENEKIHEHRIQIYREFLDKNVFPNIRKKEDKERLEYLITKYINMVDVAKGLAIGRILPPARVNCYKEIIDNNIKDIIKKIEDNPKKTLIFTSYLEITSYIEEYLKKNNIGCVKIIGSTKNRMDIIQEFKKDDDIDVLIATTQTLSTGVTLTEANQILFFGTPFRSADFNQACDRIHRIGQNIDCFIYVVLLETMEKNITTRIQEILDWSQNQFDNYIERNENN